MGTPEKRKGGNAMRQTFLRVSTVCGVFAGMVMLVAVPLRAHHAFSAEFDGDKPVQLRGTVTKVEWINPHSWIHLDVKGPNGKVDSWMVEGGSPNSLIRRGFSKASLPPGTEIVVAGFQAKDGGLRANGRDLTLPDGRTLFMGSAGTPGGPEDAK
jgi:hypothetical protein